MERRGQERTSVRGEDAEEVQPDFLLVKECWQSPQKFRGATHATNRGWNPMPREAPQLVKVDEPVERR